MRLCIADPPYLGRGAMLYGERAVSFPVSGTYAGNTKRAQSGDGNAAAAHLLVAQAQPVRLIETFRLVTA